MRRDPRRTGAAAALAALAWLAVAPAPRAGAPPAARAEGGPILFLGDGGTSRGALVASEGPDVVRWQGDAFTGPFDLIPARVAAVRWPAPKAAPTPAGPFVFETAGGDLLFGALVRLDETGAVLDVPPSGKVTLGPSTLRRFAPVTAGGELVYAGPNGLAGWSARSEGGWREEGSDLLSDVAGSSVRAGLAVPPRAAIELEVSWTKKPGFVVALGVPEGQDGDRAAFRFEVWDDDLVAVTESADQGDVASLQKVGDGRGRAHVLAFLDAGAGRFVVTTPEGRTLADLRSGGNPEARPGDVFLANAAGDVRVERLRVSRWDGVVPDADDGKGPRVRRTDGPAVAGRSVAYDPDARALVVAADSGEVRVPLDAVAGVRLDANADDRERTIRASAHDGTRVSGEIVRVTDDALVVAVPGVAEPLTLPFARLRSIQRVARHIPARDPSGLPGVLEADGLRLHGWLVPAAETGGAGCLVWQPYASANASPLRPGVAGRIVYKEESRPPEPSVQERARALAMQQAAVVQRVVVNGRVTTRRVEPPVATDPGRRMIHLRTGDMIVGDVLRVDEQGIWFKSPSSDNTFIPHEKVKAVELGKDVRRTVVLTRTKFDRLMTLPRMQKGSPPTHLLRSVNGDYLRGRVVAMDDKALRVEVRLEVREIPRDRVARITWLHADETDPSRGPAAPAAAPGTTRVQAVKHDGLRLTFVADRFADNTLSGTSDVLGACRVRLDEVDRVLIGGAIEADAAKLAAQQWKLHNAPEPHYARDDGGAGGGTESELVGKPAPDFTLDLLGDGNPKFHLADAKGSVVILDFWATWCGPCLQAMPQVERVAGEFKDRGVKLVAVNLQETPEQVSALLKRQDLHPTVALDRDGAVAAKYRAVAIPQTVIVDREGKIARLFVGSSPDLDDRLRDALKAVLDGPPPAPADGGAVKD